MMKKVLVVGAIALAIGLSYYQTHKLGVIAGASEVQEQWDEAEKKRGEQISKLEGQYSELESLHKKREEELTNELTLANAQHEDELSRYRSDYAGRLQLSEQRASVYKRQANGSASEQQRLARHAAELDRSLEEGRHLVRELGQTLKQREVTIRALGGIILNDRTLLE